ncbi:hypothetical protein PO909_003530 [Leuciscus waleckii]
MCISPVQTTALMCLTQSPNRACGLKLKEEHVSLLSELHQRAVNEALQSKNGHLDLFLRFLLGLLVTSHQILLQRLMTLPRSRSDSNEETVEYIKKKIRTTSSPEKSINLFHCLNELGDHSLVGEIQQSLKYGTLAEVKLSSSQWSALVFVLLTSEQVMDVFELNKFVAKKKFADKVLWRLLPVIKESRSARLDDCNITDKGCVTLASALSSNSSQLRDLDLSENKLRDSGVKRLSDGLKDPHCKLQKLNLYHCGVTDEGCAALASALRSNPEHLKELDFTENKIGDLGLKLLSDVLKDSLCVLEKLRLLNCGVTDEGFAALTSALRSNPSHLRHLDLSQNKIGDSGVIALSAGLKDPHCRLEKLKLMNCGITDEGFAALTSALRSNPSHLRHLDLSQNKIGDSGVIALSAGLEDPLCRLEKLKLMNCGITDEGCATLTSALRSNPEHLRDLDLSLNELDPQVRVSSLQYILEKLKNLL